MLPMLHGLQRSTLPLSSWNIYTRNIQGPNFLHSAKILSKKVCSNVAAVDDFVESSFSTGSDDGDSQEASSSKTSSSSETVQTQSDSPVNLREESDLFPTIDLQDSTLFKREPRAYHRQKCPSIVPLLHSGYIHSGSRAPVVGLRNFSVAKTDKENDKASSPLKRILFEMLRTGKRSSASKGSIPAQPFNNSIPKRGIKPGESRVLIQHLRALIMKNKSSSDSASQKDHTEIKHETWKPEEWKPEEWKDEWSNVAKMPQALNEVSSNTVPVESNHGLKSQNDPSLDMQSTSEISSLKAANSPRGSIPRFMLERAHSKAEAARRKKIRLTKILSDPSFRSIKPSDLRRASRITLAAQKQTMRHCLQRNKLAIEPVAAGTEKDSSTLSLEKTVRSLELQPPLGVGEVLTSGTLDKFAKDDILKDIQADVSYSRTIPSLQHGLDRVLFNQSVHWLQDPHSRVYNFSPLLQTLPAVTDFAFERLPPYRPSSEDDTLRELARDHSKRFVGTTSSLTRILSHIYFLLSDDKLVNISKLSMAFFNMSRKFSSATRVAYSFSLIHRRLISADGNTWDSYAIDAGIGLDPKEKRDSELNVLLWMGTMMEKFLTYPPEKFAHLLRKNPSPNSVDTKGEAYRYSKSSKFIMRSQLDCHDPRLPGTGVFDLKTRAVLPIRLDQLNLHENSGYLIRNLTGEFESFEREYYDLIRSAFLKFNFQARIGAMDGIFVSYHNTEQQFGFQYIPVTEMENALYGSQNPDAGRLIFHRCIELMEVLLEQIVSRFPAQNLYCTIHKNDMKGDLDVWVRPMDSKPGDDSIELLKVKVSHLVNNKKVDGRTAIEQANESWTIDYRIQRSMVSRSKLWMSLEVVMNAARSFAMYLPDGVSEAQARKSLALVNYSAGIGLQWDPEDRVSTPSVEQEVMVLGYKPLVEKSPLLITRLRMKSRQGRTDSLKDQASMRDHVVYTPLHGEVSAKLVLPDTESSPNRPSESPKSPTKVSDELKSVERVLARLRQLQAGMGTDESISVPESELNETGEKETKDTKRKKKKVESSGAGKALVLPSSLKRRRAKGPLNTEQTLFIDSSTETLSEGLRKCIEQRKEKKAEKEPQMSFESPLPLPE